MQIERDELQQLVVLHLGQQHLGAALEQLAGELPLRRRSARRSSPRPCRGRRTCAPARSCVWPMRNARSVAWFSTAGFHQRSKWIDVRGRGEVEAGAAGLEREHEERHVARPPETARPAPCASPPASRRAARARARPKTPPRNAASGAVDLAELGEDQHLLLPRGDRPRRSRAGARTCRCRPRPSAPSPSHCDGWLQICLSRISEASTTPAPLRCRRRSSSSLGQLVHRLLVERRLLAAQWQYAFTSVLSGRSAMTVLSVFSRRRM